MIYRGVLHAHTNLSHDGTLSVRELADWYKSHGYHFLAITEHSQDMTPEKVGILEAQSQECSSASFCIIPGIEYTCAGTIHIPGIGVTAHIDSDDPVVVSNQIHEHKGFAILAHPRRIGWQCSEALLHAVDAVELWNVAYDGKFLPSIAGLNTFPEMRKRNPKILAIACHDLHRTVSFYDVAVEMELNTLDRRAILEQLHAGNYTIESRWFRVNSAGEIGWMTRQRLRFLTWNIGVMKKARTQVLRWTA